MKVLIPTLLLILSFNVLAERPPPASAFKGDMYGYEVAVYVNDIFSGQYGLRVSYKTDGGWVYITEPDFYASEIDTQAKADAMFLEVIDEINIAVYEALNDISQEPPGGIERMQWLLENKLSIVDNQLVVN